MRILIINGPNINMLGIREPDIYGRTTYADLCAMIRDHAADSGTEVTIYQSNHEGDLVRSSGPMAPRMRSSSTQLPIPIPASRSLTR